MAALPGHKALKPGHHCTKGLVLETCSVSVYRMTEGNASARERQSVPENEIKEKVEGRLFNPFEI